MLGPQVWDADDAARAFRNAEAAAAFEAHLD